MIDSEKFWNRIAKNYDKPAKKSNQSLSKNAEFAIRYLKKSDIILDHGCATGKTSIDLFNEVKEIHAIDISPKMIEIAEGKANGRNINNINFVNTTIFDEGYYDESFDVIMSFYILHLVEDIEKVLQRAHQLLRPGGLFISTTPCLGENKFLLAGILFLGSKLRLLPKINSFQFSELENLILSENFHLVDSEKLSPSSTNYFIVVKKKLISEI